MLDGGIIVPNNGWVEVGVETTKGTEQTTRNPLICTSEPTTSVDRAVVERARVKHSRGGVAHGVIDNKITGSFQVAVSPVAFSDGAAPPTPGPRASPARG